MLLSKEDKAPSTCNKLLRTKPLTDIPIFWSCFWREWSESVSCSTVSDSLWRRGRQPSRLLCPWDSPGKNTGVGCHFLLLGIFLTQESNPGLLHCRNILCWLSYAGRPNEHFYPTQYIYAHTHVYLSLGVCIYVYIICVCVCCIYM